MDWANKAVVPEHGVVSAQLLRDITIQWSSTSLAVRGTSIGCYPWFDVCYIPIKTIFLLTRITYYQGCTCWHVVFCTHTPLFIKFQVYSFMIHYFLVVTVWHYFYFLGLGHYFLACPCCLENSSVFPPTSVLFSFSGFPTYTWSYIDGRMIFILNLNLL